MFQVMQMLKHCFSCIAFNQASNAK